jgi:hypothetical protein
MKICLPFSAPLRLCAKTWVFAPLYFFGQE